MSDSINPGCFPPTAEWDGEIYHEESTLPLGEWHVMANGRIHKLNIISVSGGTVAGEYNDLPIEDGEWDGKVLTFNRVETRGIFLRQKFKGYLMQYVNPDYKWRIAGVLKHVPDKHEFGPSGWYATRPRKGS